MTQPTGSLGVRVEDVHCHRPRAVYLLLRISTYFITSSTGPLAPSGCNVIVAWPRTYATSPYPPMSLMLSENVLAFGNVFSHANSASRPSTAG